MPHVEPLLPVPLLPRRQQSIAGALAARPTAIVEPIAKRKDSGFALSNEERKKRKPSASGGPIGRRTSGKPTGVAAKLVAALADAISPAGRFANVDAPPWGIG
jgi:hypothetical protein